MAFRGLLYITWNHQCNYVFSDSFPGLFDRIHGRRSQKSSLMMSMCSMTIWALFRNLRCLSACDFDSSSGTPVSISVIFPAGAPDSGLLAAGDGCSSNYSLGQGAHRS